MIFLLSAIVINPFLVVISKPLIVVPFPSVIVLYVKPSNVVSSVPSGFVIVRINYGVFSLCEYINSFCEISKYK